MRVARGGFRRLFRLFARFRRRVRVSVRVFVYGVVGFARVVGIVILGVVGWFVRFVFSVVNGGSIISRVGFFYYFFRIRIVNWGGIVRLGNEV